MRRFLLLSVIVSTYFQLSSQKINSSLVYSVSTASANRKMAPVLILLHGYGSNEYDLMEMAKEFDKRFITFSLRAPIRLEEGSYSWYDVQFLPDNALKYSYAQVAAARDSILSFIRQACIAYNADSNKVFVLGFSQGAIMAYDIGLSSPASLKGIVALSGRMIEETKALKTDWNAVKELKIFIGHGTSDNVIKLSDSESANEFLKSKKVKDLTYKSYDMPHAIKGVEITDISAWLTRSLGSPQTPAKKKIIIPFPGGVVI